MSRKSDVQTGIKRSYLWGLVLAGIFILSCRAVSVGLPGVGEINGSGTILTENRSVGDFERLSIRGTGIIHLTQGARPALTVTADDNLLQYIFR